MEESPCFLLIVVPKHFVNSSEDHLGFSSRFSSSGVEVAAVVLHSLQSRLQEHLEPKVP